MARKKKTVTPEEINKETAKAVAEEVVEKVEEVTEEVKDEPAPEVTEEPACAVEEKAEAAEEKAEAAVEESTPEVETVAEDVEGGSPETSTPTDETIEAEETEVAEDAEGGSPGTSTPTEESEAPAEFMNIEHFADYHSKDEAVAEETEATEEITENAEDGVEATDEVIEEVAEAVEGDKINEEEFHEYENLTILDELEDEEAPLPPAVRKVSKDEEPYNEKKPRRVDERFDIIEMFVCMLVAIMLLSAFVFRHSVVDGDSMMNTLYDNEHLIISNFFYEPKQYDIIVCEDYSTGLKKPIIKRVIATEGQTVRVVSMDEVYVDGVLVDTSFILIDGKEELIYASQYPIECVVPEGEVFVMGDHRNNSLDSRILGTIDEDTILGKVVLRFYPFDSFGKVE